MKGGRHLRVLVVCGALAVGVITATWAAMAATNDPLPAPARFALTVDGNEIASFSELGGVISGIDPSQLELNAGSLKLPGKQTPPTVTLKRGMTRDTVLWTWHEAALGGDAGARKNAYLVMYATDGSPVARFYLENAWPSKVEIGGLKAGASEVLLETVTLVCERLERVPV
jgi:phage tail-like protein